jgi:hypothetical protein
MFGKKLAQGALVAAASIGLVLGAMPSASANDMSWTLKSASGTVLAKAFADDSANRVQAWDTYGNDRNVRLDVWRVGNEGGTHVYCRDNVAADGVKCDKAMIWVEDTHLAGRLCEMNGSTATRCTGVKEFYN